MGPRRSEFPRREGQRQGSQEAIRKHSQTAVPESLGIRTLPRELRTDRFRSAATREAKPADFENPAEDRALKSESHTSTDREILQRKPLPLRRARTPRPGNHPYQDGSPGQEREARNRIGYILCDRCEEGLDRPHEQAKRRAPPGRGERTGGESARRSSVQGE